ncbi:hypothetical protein ACFQQB_08685 [Nonomuraea rubra]|uniref:hypothetical protein n=1 Tax=Nonomuraea rubra TaxID=46180 RepID=UPI0036109B62
MQDSPHVARRPLLTGWREGAEARQHTDRKGIPLIRLSEAGTWPEVLAPRDKAATHVISRDIPRAHPDIQPGEPVPKILARIVAELRSNRLRFPRYRLAALLAEQLAETHGGEERARRILREADRNWGWGVDTANTGAESVPFPVNLLLRLVPGFLHDLRLSGRVPGLGGRFRWLRRALSQDDRTAPGVPALLAALDPADEQRVSRLLLRAFMDDLARQYRRSPAHVRGAAHVFYPPAAQRARRRAGRADAGTARRPRQVRPGRGGLLHAGRRPGRGRRGAAVDAHPLAQELVTADDAATWHQVLGTPLVISAPPLPPGLARYDVADLTWVPPARVAPWWSSWVAITLFWMVLAGAVGAYAGQTAAWHRSACATGLWTPWTESGRQLAGTECVGVAEPDYLFAPGNEEMRQVQAVLQQQNERAAQLSEGSGRPYVTLVYLAALTSSDNDTLAAAREGLAGVAIAQKRQNSAAGPSEPLVRILLANAGGRMQHGSASPACCCATRTGRRPSWGSWAWTRAARRRSRPSRSWARPGCPWWPPRCRPTASSRIRRSTSRWRRRTPGRRGWPRPSRARWPARAR